MKSLRDYIDHSEPGDSHLNESLVGKGYAIAQNRAHGANKSKLYGIASKIQGTARRGLSEAESEKRDELLFSLLFDLASALKILAEMSRNSINVGTAGVLDTESVKKELRKTLITLRKT